MHPGQFFIFQTDGPTVRYCISFFTATLGLTSTTKGGARGSFIGYSAAGLPLYNFTNSTLHQTSRSALLQASSFLKQILADHNSRRIFYFLCLNLSKFNYWMFPVCHSSLFSKQEKVQNWVRKSKYGRNDVGLWGMIIFHFHLWLFHPCLSLLIKWCRLRDLFHKFSLTLKLVMQTMFIVPIWLHLVK